jgi:hypothetical protein
MAFGYLKGFDLDIQPDADFIDHAVYPPPQEPAGAGNQHPIQNRPDRHGQ